MSTVYLVVPEGIDDPTRPSGGNVYDRRICDGLTAAGWSVHLCQAPGAWPMPGRAARLALGAMVARLPDGALVLVDGLVASAVSDELVHASGRLRLVVLLHMPLGGDLERSVLAATEAVITTSEWTRQWLMAEHALGHERVHVVEPGVDTAELATGTESGNNFLCVAAVTPAKGHDILVAALTSMKDLLWRCLLVGSTTRDPGFVAQLEFRARAAGIDDRLELAGPRTGAALDQSYAGADLVVLASRSETYGMVISEALARGLPVVASEVGGVPEALGLARDGSRPGLLVPPEDPTALAGALRQWLHDAALRRQLRSAARRRRESLRDWSEASAQVGLLLAGVAR